MTKRKAKRKPTNAASKQLPLERGDRKLPTGQVEGLPQRIQFILDELEDGEQDPVRSELTELLRDVIEFDQGYCECEREGTFNCGVPGVLATLSGDGLSHGLNVQRCDTCKRFPDDRAAEKALDRFLAKRRKAVAVVGLARG